MYNKSLVLEVSANESQANMIKQNTRKLSFTSLKIRSLLIGLHKKKQESIAVLQESRDASATGHLVVHLNLTISTIQL